MRHNVTGMSAPVPAPQPVPGSTKRKYEPPSAPSYVYPDTREEYTRPKKQVKYGPAEGLSTPDKQTVYDHLYSEPQPDGKEPPTLADSVASSRLTQYAPNHQVYVDQAEAAHRPLTIQEHEAATTGRNASGASINHVIASGVGQNTLNAGIVQFVRAREQFEATMAEARQRPEAEPRPTSEAESGADLTMDTESDPDPELLEDSTPTETQTQAPAPREPSPLVAAIRARERFRIEDADQQRAVTKSLAEQAAAVGRQQIYSRAIAAEQVDRNGTSADRSDLLKTTLNAMQGSRGPVPGDGDTTKLVAYRGLMKQTFDSPGNLRVGHSGINGVVSTGMDMELGPDGQPLPRSQRLLEAHLAAAPDHDEAKFTTFKATGERLSSSKAAPLGPPIARPTGVTKPKRQRQRKQATTKLRGATKGATSTKTATPRTRRGRGTTS